MLIPKGKTLVWKGIKYLPGQKVLPAHVPKIRELLKLRKEEPIAEEPIRDTIPAPKSQPKEPPKEETKIIESKGVRPPPVSPTILGEEDEPTIVEEKKEKKPRRKKSKE